jgi:hypothetical protein
MALNASGPISLAGATTGQSIALELSLSATGQISLNDAAVRTLAGVASGAITMPTDFWGKSSGAPVFLVTHTIYPYLSAYPWSSASGFGAKYADPATALNNIVTNGGGSIFNSNGTAIALNQGGSPYIAAYQWSSSGFGSKYANPASPPAGDGELVAFTPNDTAFGTAHGGVGSGYCSVWAWSNASGFGTKYANPASPPTGTGNSCDFNPSGNVFVVTSDNTPFIIAYAWSDVSGFGTRYANPASFPADDGSGVAFSPSGNAISLSSERNGEYYVGWPWNNASGFGTRFASTVTADGSGRDVAFNPAGNTWFGSGAGTVRVYAAPWNDATGFGTKYANPATLPTGAGNAVACNSNGTSVAVGHSISPFATAYPWSNASGFGTKYANPATLPTGTGQGVAFNNLS